MWYIGFAGYYLFLKKKGILYKNKPLIIIGWYGFIISIISLLFSDVITQTISSTQAGWWLFGAITVVIATICWYRALIGRNYVERQSSRNVFFAKTTEIIFQQVMVWGLFGMLSTVLVTIHPVLVFAGVFFIIHIPLALVIPFKKALFFIIASIFGGLFFGAMIWGIPSGWLLALACHIGFYAVIASRRKIFGIDAFYVM